MKNNPLPCPKEILEEIVRNENKRLDISDIWPEYAAYFPNYSTDSQGYVGPLVVVVWQGDPGAMSTFIKSKSGWEHCNSSAW